MNSFELKTQTKIVATIGPATASKEMLKKIMQTGVNVCRLNFSHGKHEDHLQVMERILELNDELGLNVAILADLQGPKLRIGEVENNGVELVDGHELEFTNNLCIGTENQVYMSYHHFPQDVAIGDFILIDDGKIKLQATYTNHKDTVRAKVIHGGILSSKKGVNLPNTKISQPSLTEKDLADANFALEHEVDWIALSFVRTVNDINDLKDLVLKKAKQTKIIAKIEKPEAIEVIDDIIDAADGIMVARGDLGVEMPFEQVPLIQKMIVEKCIKMAKPVIIATQMMESMIENFRPTRAEATDVANAVIDGADALMLSAETSTGKYPVDVIQSMKQIIHWTEQNGYQFNRLHEPTEFNYHFFPDSICSNACNMARQTGANTIVSLTNSGYTAFRIASHRPNASIFVFTPNQRLLRQMGLLWGVRTIEYPGFGMTNEAVEYTLNFLKDNNLIHENEMVVHVGRMPLNKQGHTNMIKLSYV